MKAIRYIQWFVWLALGTTIMQAEMALTPAGIAEGLSLSTFATNFPSVSGIGPLGIVFPGSGVMVCDAPGNVRVFPSHADGQNAAAVPPTVFYDGNADDLAELNGHFYMTQPSAGVLLEVNADGTSNQVIRTGLSFPLGIVANPFTGHLFVATTPGIFVRPPAYAEEMYNPSVYGRSDGGVFTVKPRER